VDSDHHHPSKLQPTNYVDICEENADQHAFNFSKRRAKTPGINTFKGRPKTNASAAISTHYETAKGKTLASQNSHLITMAASKRNIMAQDQPGTNGMRLPQSMNSSFVKSVPMDEYGFADLDVQHDI